MIPYSMVSDPSVIAEMDRQLQKYSTPDQYLHRLHTYNEAAQLLGVSKRTLQRWVNEDGAPHHGLGRPKFTGADIEAIRDMKARGTLS